MRFPLLLVCCLFVSSSLTYAQSTDTVTARGTFTINNIEFSYIKLKPASGTPGQEIFELYAHNRKLLTHILIDDEGDCNSESLELGDVAFTDSSITFYSYWAWAGGCCGMPYGARKQVYTVNKKGQLLPGNAEIFLENYKTSLSSMTDKDAARYKATVEKNYHEKFVAAGQETGLIEEVKPRFAKQLLVQTAGWEKNKYGFRR